VLEPGFASRFVPCSPAPHPEPHVLWSLSGGSVMMMMEVYEAVSIIGLEMFARLHYGQLGVAKNR